MEKNRNQTEREKPLDKKTKATAVGTLLVIGYLVTSASLSAFSAGVIWVLLAALGLRIVFDKGKKVTKENK